MTCKHDIDPEVRAIYRRKRVKWLTLDFIAYFTLAMIDFIATLTFLDATPPEPRQSSQALMLAGVLGFVLFGTYREATKKYRLPFLPRPKDSQFSKRGTAFYKIKNELDHQRYLKRKNIEIEKQRAKWAEDNRRRKESHQDYLAAQKREQDFKVRRKAAREAATHERQKQIERRCVRIRHAQAARMRRVPRLVARYSRMSEAEQARQPGWIASAAFTEEVNLIGCTLAGRDPGEMAAIYENWPYTTHDASPYRVFGSYGPVSRRSFSPVTGNASDWELDQLPDLTPLLRTASPRVRNWLTRQYLQRLAHAFKPPGERARPHSPIDPHKLSPAAKLLFLPAIIAAGKHDAPDRLDFERSDLTAGRYVYRAADSIIDLNHWEKNLPDIERYFGIPLRLEAIDGECLGLSTRPQIPASFPMQPDWLQPGKLFFGLDMNTGMPFHVPIRHLSHLLMQGPSGMGKSTFMHQIMASVVTNSDMFETVYMVDLKFGLEAQHYIGLAENLLVIDDHDQVPDFLDQLTALMNERKTILRESRKSDWEGPLTLILIDEFADMFLGAETSKERNKLENRLIRIANLSRALGIRIWVQVQDATATSMPTPFKRNLQSRIGFTVSHNSEAAQLFGSSEGLPADMTKFAKGQAIYRDGKTSDTYALQGAFVRFEDVAKLAGS